MTSTMRKQQRRWRLLLTVLAAGVIVIVIALWLVVDHADQNERAMRRIILANRLCSELERELDRFVQREDARPPYHYRHFFVPNRAVGGSKRYCNHR